MRLAKHGAHIAIVDMNDDKMKAVEIDRRFAEITGEPVGATYDGGLVYQ